MNESFKSAFKTQVSGPTLARYVPSSTLFDYSTTPFLTVCFTQLRCQVGGACHM